MRLIDADAIRVKLKYLENICGIVMIRAEDLARIINEQPAILRNEELVQCKDCKYGYCINPSYDEKENFYECMKYPIANLRITHKPEWFCADGEHK